MESSLDVGIRGKGRETALAWPSVGWENGRTTHPLLLLHTPTKEKKKGIKAHNVTHNPHRLSVCVHTHTCLGGLGTAGAGRARAREA